MNMQKQKPIWSKILAMLCALALCISMVPAASAARPSTTSSVTKAIMNVPEGITFYDSYAWNMTLISEDDAILDDNDNKYYYEDTAFKYAYVDDSLWFKSISGNTLPKNITFYAKANYQPVISAGEGSPVTVTVSPVTGNNTYNWVITVSFGEASGEVNLTVTPGQPETYNVTFAEGDYSVTVTEATATGSDKSYTATEGTDVTFTLAPNDGFTITQVVANETTILKANESGVYTISNIQENKSIAVTTEKKTYSISFNEEESGEKHYTLIQGASPVAHGGSYTFSVIPKAGYGAPTVMVSEATLTPTNYAYTIGNITENKTITITNGTAQQRTVTFTSGDGYSFEGANNTTISNDKATVNYGGSVSFEVVLDDDYDNSNVIVYANGSELEVNEADVYTINNITVDQTVSVVGVEKKKYTVTLPENWTGYTISTVDGTSVPAGGTFTFTVTPAAGYTITKVTADDQELTSENNQYSIEVNQDTTIEVTATASQYTVDVGATNATVSLASTVSYGNNTFTVTPDAGYKVDSVTFDGATVAPGANNNYTIYVTRNDHRLVVTTSPVVNVTLTTTVTATGDKKYTIVVKTFPGEVTGNSDDISVVGYGTLYSNQSFDSQSLKDTILGLTLNDTLTQQPVSYAPVVYSYGMKTNFPLYELRNTFSYTFNNSSSKVRYGAGWIKLSDGQNSWIVFSNAVQCL